MGPEGTRYFELWYLFFFLDPKYVWSFDVVRIVEQDSDLQEQQSPTPCFISISEYATVKRDGPSAHPSRKLPVRAYRSSGELGPVSH